MDELGMQQQEAAATDDGVKMRNAWEAWEAWAVNRPHWGPETYEAYCAGLLDGKPPLAEKERVSMLEELLLALQSDEIYRDDEGLHRWGDACDGDPNPPGPMIGAHVIDLLHALGAWPK
jgi:hypothetical protein